MYDMENYTGSVTIRATKLGYIVKHVKPNAETL
jgi:hypothetical protein